MSRRAIGFQARSRAARRPASRGATSLAAVLAAMALHGTASAHDTWFTPQPGAADTQTRLVLGTGAAWPVYGWVVLPEHLADARCSGKPGAQAADAHTTALLPQPAPDDAGAVQAQLLHLGPTQPAAHCWVQLKPAEVAIDAEHVAVYLDEAQASAAARRRWAEQHKRGQAWQETYRKLARAWLDLQATAPPPALPESGLDLRPLAMNPKGRVTVQVERHGRPLAGQPVQWLRQAGTAGNAGPADGGWTLSDRQGRVHLQADQAGAWLVRAIHLQAATGDRWQGDFATLAFNVPAAASEVR